MKPSRQDIEKAWFDVTGRAAIVFGDALGFAAIMEVIDRAWEADEAEREIGKSALSAFRSYGRHSLTCPRVLHNGTCICGYSAALESLNTLRDSRDPDLPSVDEMVGILSEARLADDAERFNELQRAKRDAFEAAGLYYDPPQEGYDYYLWLKGVRVEAARRYPIRKRVAKVIPDPHGLGKWRVRAPIEGDEQGRRLFQILAGALDWHDANTGIYWSEARVRVLAGLLDDPFEVVDDPSVEDGEE